MDLMIVIEEEEEEEREKFCGGLYSTLVTAKC